MQQDQYLRAPSHPSPASGEGADRVRARPDGTRRNYTTPCSAYSRRRWKPERAALASSVSAR